MFGAMDYITVGPTPCDEVCVQLGTDDYRSKAIIEMDAYIDQLYRQFPDVDNNDLTIRKMWFNHDFGKYGEVAIMYSTDSHVSADYALHIEANLPMNWDEESLKVLREKGLK